MLERGDSKLIVTSVLQTQEVAQCEISLGSIKSVIPPMISLIREGDKEPIFSMRSDLFTVIICVVLTTLSFLRLASPFLRRTLPGDLALVRLEVSAQTTTVLILL